jgi:Zn-dependent peptidase ImmA (M78 family)
MDEFQVVLKAREMVRKVNPTTIPVAVELYAKEVGAVIKPQTDMGPDESASCFEANGKRFICTNANERSVRQRFSICHEVAHLKLGLPSQHKNLSWWSYEKRPLAEILCDVFASELLLPFGLFQPEAERATIGLSALDELAERFQASFVATGSRFAAVASAPVAFVLSEQGKVRYASRSKSLQEAFAWIPPRTELPEGSLSKRVCKGAPADNRYPVDADIWFSDWERGGTLLEEVRQLGQWNQTLTLLWFDDEQVPGRKVRDERGAIHDEDESEDDALLKGLDGQLRWPSKHRRS